MDEARVCDNTRAATPYRLVAGWRDGRTVGQTHWPSWTPPQLREAPPTGPWRETVGTDVRDQP